MIIGAPVALIAITIIVFWIYAIITGKFLKVLSAVFLAVGLICVPVGIVQSAVSDDLSELASAGVVLVFGFICLAAIVPLRKMLAEGVR